MGSTVKARKIIEVVKTVYPYMLEQELDALLLLLGKILERLEAEDGK